MALRREPVRLVIDARGIAQSMERIRIAADAHPMRDDETPAQWMRRVIDAACWRPDGWSDSPEATSPASDEEG